MAKSRRPKKQSQRHVVNCILHCTCGQPAKGRGSTVPEAEADAQSKLRKHKQAKHGG